MAKLSREAMYERIVETTREGVWLIDANSRTTFVNQSLADMLGYTRDELVGRSMFDLMTDEGRGIAADVEHRKQAIANAQELVFRRKDGRALWARMTTNLLHDEVGTYTGALALLTETRHEDQERERLWRIVDESLNEVYLFREDDLRFEYVNHGALANLGFTLDDMRSRTPIDIEPLHTLASFREMLVPLVEGTQQKLVFETIHRRRDGSTYPTEVHLQLVPGVERMFVAIINDTTYRMAAQRELEASEARFRALIENSLDLLLLAGAGGRFTFASPSVLPMLGYTPEELLAIDPQELVHPDDRGQTFGAFAAATHADVTERIEFRVRHRDGSWRTLWANGRNLLANPNVRALVLNARDVTNERRLEDQLQQAHRLESIGRLAGGVAHDFNNLLTTILASVTFLEEDPDLPETARADVHEIKRAGGRAGELTNQLLTFARKQLIRPHSIALQQLLASQDRFLRRVLGEHVELRTHVADDLWPIFADPSQLEQVVMNLAVNARDAMPEGGQLTIEAHNLVVDESFASVHAEVTPGPYVQIVVSDTGEGIPAAVLPHIFEPFFTTKEVGAGTGLGLAMVYGIIRQSGGHIWVYSEPEGGTTFKIYLPRGKTSESAVADAPAPAVTGGAERLLVVEDDEHVRRVLVRTLTRAGYDVHGEPTPRDGLAWARAQDGRFQMLITDVVMPGMSGKELVAQLTAEFPRVRTLYLSGYTENTIVQRGVLETGVNFLGKPFSTTALLALVRAILDRS